MIDTTILSLIGVETSLIEKYEFLGENNNEIILSIKLASSEKDTCPKCGSSLRKIKDYTYKRYKYYGLVTKTITVVFAQKRFICDCGKTKMQHNPFIKRNSGYKVTLNIKKAIINLLKENLSSAFIAKQLGISDQTVLRVLNSINPKSGNSGQILCIDEFSYKKTRGKKQYGCILINGENNTLIDVLSERTSEKIHSFLYKLTKNNENKIEFFCMDMFDAYREAVKAYNSEAIIVVDRFHLVRRLNKVIDDIRIRVMKTYEEENFHYILLKKFRKKLLKKSLDSNQHLIKFKVNEITRTAYENEIVNELLSYNNDLKTAYEKIHLWINGHDSWNEIKAESQIDKLIQFIEEHTTIPELNALLPTLKEWRNEIITSYISVNGKKLSNAISESSVRKIKDLKRVLHGFNNFWTFRARCFLIFSKKDPVKFGDF